MPAETVLHLRSDNVLWRDVGAEIVALDQRTWHYLGLNEAGKLLWEALAGGATRDELAGRIAATYGIAADRAQADVDAFLSELRRRDLLSDAPR